MEGILSIPDSTIAALTPGERDDVLAPYRRAQVDRRPRDQRLTRDEVPWLSAVKLAWGLEVSLLNISSTGVLVETTSKLTPGSVTELELCGPDTNLVIPARFIRSEVAQVDTLSVKYHAAAVFTRALRLPTVLRSGRAPKALADLLTHVLTDVDNCGPRLALREKFEQGLRHLVSARDVRIRDAVSTPPHGRESVYFTVLSASGSRAILQATFEPGHELTHAEFNLLKSAATLATAVLEFEKMA